MTDTEPTEATAEPREEIDDTVPCPACHQPVRLGLLAEKYAADVPAKFKPRAGRGKDEN